MCGGEDETKRTEFQRKEKTLRQNYLPTPGQFVVDFDHAFFCRLNFFFRRAFRG
jgi:hypothetical protein